MLILSTTETPMTRNEALILCIAIRKLIALRKLHAHAHARNWGSYRCRWLEMDVRSEEAAIARIGR